MRQRYYMLFPLSAERGDVDNPEDPVPRPRSRSVLSGDQ